MRVLVLVLFAAGGPFFRVYYLAFPLFVSITYSLINHPPQKKKTPSPSSQPIYHSI